MGGKGGSTQESRLSKTICNMNYLNVTIRKKRRSKLKDYVEVIGKGETCRKCSSPMQRRKRIKPPKQKTYFYTEWDYCIPCGHLQHYDHFRSEVWKEEERQQSFLKSI